MRNRKLIKIEALYRHMMLRYMAGSLPIILITEYPKCGASWLGQMLSEITGLPFPRQEFPKFGQAIYHGHYLGIKTKAPTIVFWRDPRDVMVSWYHHCLFHSDKNHPDFVNQYRSALAFEDVDDVEGNLASFIRLVFESPISPRFTFNDFVDFWHGRNGVVECSYEDFKSDPVTSLDGVLRALNFRDYSSTSISLAVEKYTFSKQANRKPGEEDSSSYLRKGVVGDWVNYFTSESARILDDYLGDRLIKLGYEKDHSWVNLGIKE